VTGRVFLFLNGGHISDRMRVSASARVSVFDRTRWRVRSLSTGHVRSFRELIGLQPDAGTVVSGQFCSASGRCVERVRSVVRERSRCVIGASGQFD
jgi:hypothetical protein